MAYVFEGQVKGTAWGAAVVKVDWHSRGWQQYPSRGPPTRRQQPGAGSSAGAAPHPHSSATLSTLWFILLIFKHCNHFHLHSMLLSNVDLLCTLSFNHTALQFSSAALHSLRHRSSIIPSTFILCLCFAFCFPPLLLLSFIFPLPYLPSFSRSTVWAWKFWKFESFYFTIYTTLGISVSPCIIIFIIVYFTYSTL